MEQYIPKSAVLAEIKGLIRANELHLSESATDEVRFQKTGAYSVCNDLLHFLDTLEMKEVNLSLIEPHIRKEWNKINTGHTFSVIDSYYIFAGICTYFFKLGLNAWKGE